MSHDLENLGLTHLDSVGRARMVDIVAKDETVRLAVAQSVVDMSEAAAEAVKSCCLAKGDCIQVARIAAIQATKWTSHLIPLCHSIGIESVDVEHEWTGKTELRWTVSVRTTGKTGVEMEAMTGASIAALTVYDMCKSLDRSISIRNVCLVHKAGGI
ncbi:MAG: cyclic pyranopterin monophosphate synthase MoaC, partial [Planctomycetes bacterium]|nr:cyclic pyranopterin monophosphate synthase MoaC [Planctomycetota bacterium]